MAIDLDQNGFIKSVKQCIELLQEFGSKLTEADIKRFLGEQTKEYMSAQEFLNEVINAVLTNGDNFVEKINELYKVKDQAIELLNPENFNKIVELQARRIGEEYMFGEAYISQLASYMLTQGRFRDYLFAYMKMQFSDEISKIDVEKFVTDDVKKNADKYAQYLLDDTKQKQLLAEASLLVIQAVEQYCVVNHNCLLETTHPQPYGGKDGNP